MGEGGRIGRWMEGDADGDRGRGVERGREWDRERQREGASARSDEEGRKRGGGMS